MRAMLVAILLSAMLLPAARADCPGQLSEDPRAREIVDCINELLRRMEELGGGRPSGQITGAATQYQTTVSGIRATVISAGKGGQNLSVALTIENITDRDLGIALIGPKPLAILGGIQYGLRAFSGAFQCKFLSVNHAKYCTSFEGTDSSIPIRNYTRLSAGSKTTLTYLFSTYDKNPTGHVMSFSSTFARLQYEGLNVPIVTTLGIGIPGIDLTKFQ